jgi:hypothetical protein
MTVLDTLNFVAFNPLQNNNPIAVRRRKQQTKTTHLRSINGLLMTKVSKPKLKLPSVLSVGGLLALMARLTLLYVMEASH